MPNNYYAMMDLITRSDWSSDEKAQARQMVAAKGIGPALPQRPVPGALQTPAESGNHGVEEFLTSPHGFIRTGLRRAYDGLAAMTRPGLDAKAGAAAEIMQGLGTAALPAALPLAVANPVAALYGVAGGMAGGKAAKAAAGLLGAGEGTQELADQVGGLLGGGASAKYGPRITRAATGLLGDGIAEVLGKTTGNGAEGVRTAFGPHSRDFTDAMRGKISDEGLVSKLKAATDDLAQKRSQEYQADLAKLRGVDQPIEAAPAALSKALQTQLSRFNVRMDPEGTLDFSRSTIHDPSAQNQVRGIVNDLRSWGSEPGDFTAGGLDVLKRRVRDFYSESSQARAFVQGVNAPVTDLLNTVPGYKEMAGRYAASSQLLKSVNSELSSANPNPGTVLRKLQSTTNQPNKYRAALLGRLDEAAGSNVVDAAAGWGFQDLMPRGHIGRAAPFMAGATAFTHPAALPLGLLTSPRVVGEGVAALGSAYRSLPNLPPNLSPWRYGGTMGLLGQAPEAQ